MAGGHYFGEDIPNFDLIVNAIRSGKCIPFLGAGVSMTYKNWRNGQADVEGCPSGDKLRSELEEALRKKAPVPAELQRVILPVLPSIAEFFQYYDNGHRGEMENLVRRAIDRAVCPRPIHWVLAGIPSVRCVFTTNYDELLEQAVGKNGLHRRLIGPYVHDQSHNKQKNPTDLPIELIQNLPHRLDALAPPEGHPLVLYKMHGCVRHPNSLLITTYDYVQYIASWTDKRLGMPKEFRDLLLKNTILFLGYGLGDWNFRVIWEAMITAFPNGRFDIQSYAIKKPVSNFERSLFNKRNINLVECDLTLFARALAEEFEVEIPDPPPFSSVTVQPERKDAR